MIQIRKLREFIPKGQTETKKFDAELDPPVNAESVAALFENPEKFLGQIAPSERWNLYYTSHTCTTKKRIWSAPQEVLPFDIDGLNVEKIDAYLPIILTCLELKHEETGIVFSGNGLQFIVGLLTPITEEAFFERNREHYKAVCEKINQALTAASLPGKADASVFSTARLLRLPGTENRKVGKPSRQARLIQGHIEPIAFDLQDRSGLPKITATEAIAPSELKHFPVDSPSVKEGCEFLKWMKTEPKQVSEPQWFAGLSIVGRLENGRGEAHEYSKGHKGYTFAETETKLSQALASSGPRTCKNINSLWSKCHTCPNFEKINSPISIRGANFIPTETTGFHDVIVTNGKTYKKPNYSDLRKFFERDHNYKILGGSRICYVWNGKFYEELEDAYLEGFAQKHFKPHATTDMVVEFRKLVQRTNLKPPKWFEKTTERKINFQNGVLDIDNMIFSTHNDEVGFRYVLDYDYNVDAICPSWDKFVHDICSSDVSLVKILTEFAGYALSYDSCWAQKALVMTGTGENGKSTFMSVLRALAGTDNYTSLTLAELSKEGNRQLMDGKPFNMAEETPSKSLTDSSLFKNLVSGGETQVRQLYKRPYVMRNKAKLIFACNALPDSGDTTHGFFRRLIIVPFKGRFTHEKGNRDDFIEKKLIAELPGIFNQCIKGYHGLRSRKKFSESETSAQALESYRLDINTIKRWISEKCFEQGPHLEASA